MTNAENALIVWPVEPPTLGGSRCNAFVMDVGVGALLDQLLPLRCPLTLALEGMVQRGARQVVKVPRPWPPAAAVSGSPAVHLLRVGNSASAVGSLVCTLLQGKP